MGTAKQESHAPDADSQPQSRPEEGRAEQPQSGEEALNDARALQQMIEGVPDSSDEFRRIEQKR